MRLRWALLGLLACACSGQDGTGQTDDAGLPPGCQEVEETADAAVELPADEAPHEEAVEWWYWTGHLLTDDGRWFGFEEVFFLGLRDGVWGQIAHQALTDIEAGEFHHTSAMTFGRPEEVEDGFSFSVPPLTARGGGGEDVLHGEVDGWVLDLTLTDTKRPVLQHGNGYLDYPFGGYTYYYSRERMAARGQLTRGDRTVGVEGTAWFDHQWGDLAAVTDVGWDWFALQLDDERELMLFVVRIGDGEAVAGGSLTDADCRTQELHADDFTLTPRGEWTSPHSGRTYPLGWDVTVGAEVLTITPVLEDQELRIEVMQTDYWEGAATVSGTSTGRAYIELTGY